jgi:hypothetical protein
MGLQRRQCVGKSATNAAILGVRESSEDANGLSWKFWLKQDQSPVKSNPSSEHHVSLLT